MFRIKNEYEIRQSEPDECLIAYCHNPSEKLYNNEVNLIDVCKQHYDLIWKQRYGE